MSKATRRARSQSAVAEKTKTPFSARLAAFGSTREAFALASAVVLAPCFWLSRIQAGDLGSHVYNAWLAQLIEEGKAPGLALVHQNTNVLFDWMLATLMRFAGAGVAQRISVSLAVLAFVWGAFGFVSAVMGRRAWRMLPLIAILAYGWVFHIGFFNFYMSLGLCFGAIGLCWTGDPRRMAAALPLLAVAYVAHALPVVWAVSLIGYRWMSGRVTLRQRAYLLAASLVAMAALSAVIRARMATRWFPTQILSATGLDQVWVYDGKYQPIALGLLFLWAAAIVLQARESGWKDIVTGVPFQLCLLTAFAILVFPSSVLIPGYKHALAFIADRMSLPLCICLCALAGTGVQRTSHAYFAGVLAVIFFAFLYHDERALNAAEDRIEQRVITLPPNQRVISALDTPMLRVNAVGHMIDRACTGRCYSYANYEPSTAQFRVRVVGESPLVAATYEDSWALQSGTYVVKERDKPLYQVTMDQRGRMFLVSLNPGGKVGTVQWNPL